MGGNLTITGSYGAWASASIYGTAYASNAYFTWGAMTTSSNITHTANTSQFLVSQAGTYVIACSVLSGGTNGSTGFAQLYIVTSPNNSTWTGCNGSIVPAQLLYQYTNLSVNAVLALPAGTYVALQLYNTLSANLTLDSAALLNYFYMYRVG